MTWLYIAGDNTPLPLQLISFCSLLFPLATSVKLHWPILVICAGDEDQVHSVDSSTKQRACMEVNATMPGPQPAVSKVKTIKSLSEESVDNTLKSKPSLCSPKDKGPPRSADSHCRNFDTITRSGVNVQELRSRFLDRLDSSTTTKEPRGAATVKQPGLLTGGPRSPRDEALQKLGLLQRNWSFPNINSPWRPWQVVTPRFYLLQGLIMAWLQALLTLGRPYICLLQLLMSKNRCLPYRSGTSKKTWTPLVLDKNSKFHHEPSPTI